ncbi:MAG: acyl-CoA desaturase [Candidatus Staskawiczbacteria bacterium]|nr:acyl-CoA desaturase [Candidatus Staskawiczbacteria bacterium]
MNAVLQMPVSVVSFVSRYINRSVFVLIHLAVVSVFFVEVSWFSFWLFFWLWFSTMFAISAGYHRLLSHRSYGANRWFIRLPLVIWCCSALQKGPLWWTAGHVAHHLYTDVEGDPHSPVRNGSFWNRIRGFFWSHMGWILVTRKGENDFSSISYLAKCWEIRLLERFHYVPPFLLAFLCWYFYGWSGLVWGFVVRTVVLYQTTFWVNSICHMPYMLGWRAKQEDESRNNPLVALVTLGEGWHSDHHKWQTRLKQGHGWWKIDVTYYLLWLPWLISGGMLVWGLYKPIRKSQEVS